MEFQKLEDPTLEEMQRERAWLSPKPEYEKPFKKTDEVIFHNHKISTPQFVERGYITRKDYM